MREGSPVDHRARRSDFIRLWRKLSSAGGRWSTWGTREEEDCLREEMARSGGRSALERRIVCRPRLLYFFREEQSTWCWVVRAHFTEGYSGAVIMWANYTYLDGTGSFMDRVSGPWGTSIARRPCPQRHSVVCMCFGPCTVSIFSCPASATLAEQAFFMSLRPPNPNLIVS